MTKETTFQKKSLPSLEQQATAQPCVIETRKLVRMLGDKVKQTILHEIDLQINRGEFIALTGHSGSGKSTLLYLLGALDKPTTGQVIIDGVDISLLDDNARARLRNEKLGFVFQFHFLLPEFTVLENVMIPMFRRGYSEKKATTKAQKTLDYLGLGHLTKRRPSELSGGQQQRVSIARALAGEPMVILADEPTGNLDSNNAELVMSLLEQHNQEQGTTIVMVTHDSSFASRASRQVTLKDGYILSDIVQKKPSTSISIHNQLTKEPLESK